MITFKIYSREFESIQKDAGRFLPNQVKELLNNGLSDSIKTIILEYPYVENDYRDTYYNDFSKRFAYFDKNSVRLHFFTKSITEIDEIASSNDNYLGFISLRDTRINTLGRSYLNPNAIKGVENIHCVLADYSVHIKGYELKVKAFPWMQQDANVSRCAHVAIWSIIRYFSHKYNYYPQRTLYQIVNLLSSTTRKTPSNGLSVSQISEIFSKSSFSPEIYLREVIKESLPDINYDKLMYVLIESGIPYIAGSNNHAISVIGHGKLSKAKSIVVGDKKIVDSFELIDKLVVSNDNLLPYSFVHKEINAKIDAIQTYKDIILMIVPFYEKMYLDIKSIYTLVIPSIESSFITKNKQYIRRLLLISSKSFKRFIIENSTDKTYKDIVSRQHLPKFIWLIEYSTFEEFDSGLISQRVIVDASALNYEQNVAISIKRSNNIIINNTLHSPNIEEPFISYQLEQETEKQYINNLQKV